MALSESQQAVYLSEGRSVLAAGAVRSGKTHAVAMAFVDAAMRRGPALQLIAGRAPMPLIQEVLPHVQRRLDELGVPWRWNGQQSILYAATGHRFAVCAYTHRDSEARFRGVTARCALIDEAALCAEQFWDWLQTRLSLDGSQLWATCNPQGPSHWLHERVQDGRVDDYHRLLMQDNPGLPAGVIADIERQYLPGTAMHRRAILGEWAAEAGLIYPEWTVRDGPTEGDGIGAVLGIDFGMTADTAVVKIDCRVRPTSWWVSDAMTIPGSVDAHVSPSEQARRIALWVEAHPAVRAYVDPSASPLIAELRTAAPRLQVVPASNDVARGIAEVSKALVSGMLTIGPRDRCGPLHSDLMGYIWDPRREDTPRKEDDHAVDALRYAVAGLARPVIAEIM